MADVQQADMRNWLLRAMSPSDFELLRPALSRVSAPLGLVMFEAQKPIERVCFPEVGFASVTTASTAGKTELGIVGREGMVGASPILLGDDRSPHDCFIQMSGDMLLMPVEDLRRAIHRSASLNALLLRVVQAFLVQIAQTAFVNAVHTIDIRLARWLLMSHDRGEGDEVRITHDFLAAMLGVRRAGVTLATQRLEGTGSIKATRGLIKMRDRAALEALAGDSYGVAEAEYRRLMPWANAASPAG